jgi:hypothetical protein
MNNRKYLPTFAELIDRLAIVQLKFIFITDNSEAYKQEMNDIINDLDLIIKEKEIRITGDMIINIMRVMLANKYIWENESKARLGGTEQDKLLKLTHSINGIRNTAKNAISNEIGERVDLKVDCLASELIKEFGNWQLFDKN